MTSSEALTVTSLPCPALSLAIGMTLRPTSPAPAPPARFGRYVRTEGSDPYIYMYVVDLALPATILQQVDIDSEPGLGLNRLGSIGRVNAMLFLLLGGRTCRRGYYSSSRRRSGGALWHGRRRSGGRGTIARRALFAHLTALLAPVRGAGGEGQTDHEQHHQQSN